MCYGCVKGVMGVSGVCYGCVSGVLGCVGVLGVC